jgi:hypothetical protein
MKAASNRDVQIQQERLLRDRLRKEAETPAEQDAIISQQYPKFNRLWIRKKGKAA